MRACTRKLIHVSPVLLWRISTSSRLFLSPFAFPAWSVGAILSAYACASPLISSSTLVNAVLTDHSRMPLLLLCLESVYFAVTRWHACIPPSADADAGSIVSRRIAASRQAMYFFIIGMLLSNARECCGFCAAGDAENKLVFLLLPSRLRTRSCYFLARKKVTKERPEGAEEGASLDFSPLWTPPASSISCGKEQRRLSGLSALPLRCFSCGKYKIRTCLRKKRQRHRYTRIFPSFRCPLHFAESYGQYCVVTPSRQRQYA